MIGVFDSGVGGLTVLQAIHKRMPKADVVYFGDTENAPYGNKSKREISGLIAMALRRLHAAGATHIVSACNSASVPIHSIPIDLLRLRLFDVVEMIGPTVEALVPLHKKIVLFGTKATVESQLYQRAFAVRGVSIEAVAIPALAGLIERDAGRKELYPVIEEAVKTAVEKGAEILSLSCTHYPFAKDFFVEALKKEGSDAVLFDPADAVAEEVSRRYPKEGKGTLTFLTSKDSSVFNQRVEQLFGHSSYTIADAGSIYWALKRAL